MSPDEFLRHCSDEELLAFLDDELAQGDRSAVKDHVSRCWECRGRMAELDEHARRFARAFARQQFPGPKRQAAAQSRFFDAVEALERAFEQRPAPVTRRPRLRFALALALACAAALASVGIPEIRARLSRIPELLFPEPGAWEVLDEARRAESARYATAFYESYRVEFERENPPAERENSSLQVWADPPSFRLSIRWEDAGGALRYAIWQPSLGRAYHRRAGLRAATSRLETAGMPVSLTHVYSRSLEAACVECLFETWLEANRSRPFFFSRELAAETNEPGAEFTIERSAGSRLRLLVRRRAGDGLVTTAMDVDPDGYRPRSITWRISGAGGGVVIRLWRLGSRSLRPEELTAALFQPDPPPATALPRFPAPPRLLPRRPEALTARLGAFLLDAAEMLSLETKVRYALHGVGACLGEPVEIGRDADGRIAVSIRTGTETRKQELLRALETVQASELVTVSVSTFAEAARASGGPPAGGDLPATPTEAVRETTLPVETHLRRLIEERRGGGAATEEEIVRFTNQAYGDAEDLLAHAWALRRLWERYQGADAAYLRPHSQRLLALMVQEHLVELRAEASDLEARVSPLLEVAAASPAPQPGSVGPGPELHGAEEPELDLFRSAEEIHRLVLALFTGAGMPVVDSGSGGTARARLRLLTPEEALARLRQAFDEFDHRFAAAWESAGRDPRSLAAAPAGGRSAEPGAKEPLKGDKP